MKSTICFLKQLQDICGEFAAERLINNVPLTDEETKGKIIGKEGEI